MASNGTEASGGSGGAWAPPNLRDRQLRTFLMGCRARVSPTDVGLPEWGRRRTPGLRREDVAALAGVSVTWYTWLEQGRDIKVSTPVLERISAALKLSPDEREYLFALVQHRQAPAPALEWHGDEPTPAVRRMIARLHMPALLMTARWDLVAWNDLYVKVLRNPEDFPGKPRNLLRILLVDDKVYRQDPAVFEAMARRVLAKFRVDYSQFAGQPEFEDFVRELEASSETFRRLWYSAEVVGRSEAIVRHPQLGGITLEHTSYVPEGSPSLRLVIYTPHDDESAAKVDAARAAPQSQSNERRKPG